MRFDLVFAFFLSLFKSSRRLGVRSPRTKSRASKQSRSDEREPNDCEIPKICRIFRLRSARISRFVAG